MIDPIFHVYYARARDALGSSRVSAEHWLLETRARTVRHRVLSPIGKRCEVISFEPFSTPPAAQRSKIRVRTELALWRPQRKTAARWRPRTALYTSQPRAHAPERTRRRRGAGRMKPFRRAGTKRTAPKAAAPRPHASRRALISAAVHRTSRAHRQRCPTTRTPKTAAAAS